MQLEPQLQEPEEEHPQSPMMIVMAVCFVFGCLERKCIGSVVFYCDREKL